MKWAPSPFDEARRVTFAITVGWLLAFTANVVILVILRTAPSPILLGAWAVGFPVLLLAHWALYNWALARLELARLAFEAQLQTLTREVIGEKMRKGEITMMAMQLNTEAAPPEPKAH